MYFTYFIIQKTTMTVIINRTAPPPPAAATVVVLDASSIPGLFSSTIQHKSVYTYAYNT